MDPIILFVEKSVVNYAVVKVLDALISETTEKFLTYNYKLDKLLKSPINTALRYLELAKQYQRGNSLFKKNIEKAINNFNQASSNLDGIDKVRSFLYSGICSELIKDRTAAFFYFSKAYTVIEKIPKKETSLEKFPTQEAVGFTSMVVGIGLTFGSGGALLPAILCYGGMFAAILKPENNHEFSIENDNYNKEVDIIKNALKVKLTR
ncbi:MAG: hypothetical protein AAGA77_15990 [Bacteroidota bacterium]